jgi:hypothetical protein
MATPGFSLPEQLFERLFNLHTGTLHDFRCRKCDRMTEHYSTTHSALVHNQVLKFMSRLLEDYSGLGNLLEGKPYVCSVCGTVFLE